MAQHRKVERAAGGLVVRRRSGRVEVLMIDDAYGKVAFPKGHVEAGETWEQAAVREVTEETGIEARILAPLGRVEYVIARNGTAIQKQVRLFLMEEIDEQDEPVHQVEEVRGAYFLPWETAAARHDEAGYDNWKWVFNKARVLLEWHDNGWEEQWRALGADDGAVVDSMWEKVRGWVPRLMDAIRSELRVTAPEAVWQSASGVVLPLPLSGDISCHIRRAVEHTVLKPEASALDVENLCREAASEQFRAVCINPQHVPLAHSLLADTEVAVCTVAAFPLGAVDPSVLHAEVQQAVLAGATEVDMVIPVGAMREDDVMTVYQHVSAAVKGIQAAGGGALKVILETHYLTYAQTCTAAMAALAAGAEFVKTSTGFAPSGARIADVALLALIAGGDRGVKAAGGVRSRTAAQQFLRYGANRLGTSSGRSLVRQ